MKTFKGIPILENDFSRDELCKEIAVNAMKTMTDCLVEMELKDASMSDMLNYCIWPILEEADSRFRAIERGEDNVPTDGFELIVGKNYKLG